MEAKWGPYDFAESRDRIDEILAASDVSFEELNSIPSRDKLTFTNGFYVYCSALFIDIRGSSELGSKHRRPTLAKLYRAYISEMVALFKSDFNCKEVSIHGDAVWGVYDTPTKPGIDAVFSIAARANSLVQVLNYKLTKKQISPITCGLGMSYGRALMIKAGYKGSGINDIVWMGDVVNEASHLAGFGNKSYGDNALMVSDVFYGNLNDHNRGLLARNYNRSCYHGNVVNTEMNDWLESQA